MSRPSATSGWLLWMLVVTSCVGLPQFPERSVTDPEADGGPEAAAPAAPSPTLRFGAWNLRKYGFEPEKDRAAIARIVARHFDLVALLEVMWSPEQRALEELASSLAPEFALAVTQGPRPNVSSPHAEYYVVAYRRARVAPCAELPELRYFADGDGSDGSPTRGLFLREPAFGCYRTRDPGAGFDFLLAVYHAEWGDGRVESIAREVAHVDRVFGAMQAAFPGERPLYMLGDFNLTEDALAPLTTASDRTERGVGSTLDSAGNISPHLYDHLLAQGSEANARLVADARVLDVRAEAFDPKLFRQRVSDHLPIMAQLRLSEEDD